MSTVFRFTHESGTFSEYDDYESPPASITTRSAHDGAYGIESDCSQGASRVGGAVKALNNIEVWWGGWVYLSSIVMDQYDEQSMIGLDDQATLGVVLNVRRMAAGRGAADTWDCGETDRFTTMFALNTWLYAELHWRVNSATGIKEAWINGYPVFSAVRDYSGQTAVRNVGVLSGSPLGTATGNIFMDSCGVSYTERVLPQLPVFGRRRENTLARR